MVMKVFFFFFISIIFLFHVDAQDHRCSASALKIPSLSHRSSQWQRTEGGKKALRLWADEALCDSHAATDPCGNLISSHYVSAGPVAQHHGSVPAQWEAAAWRSVTAADILFPFFLLGEKKIKSHTWARMLCIMIMHAEYAIAPQCGSAVLILMVSFFSAFGETSPLLPMSRTKRC